MALPLRGPPPLQQVRGAKGAKLLFDSSMIPGEIIDIMFVRTNSDERFKKALTGAWYEFMSIMTSKTKETEILIDYLADQAGATTPEFRAQLKTTAMYYSPSEALQAVTDKSLIKTMDAVRKFSFDKGLFGALAQSPDFVGIEFPDKTVLGDKSNIKLRFDKHYMQLASENKL
jgi:NitT/TauT family transport system substrate-binding protein